LVGVPVAARTWAKNIDDADMPTEMLEVLVGPGRADLTIEAGSSRSPYQPRPKPSPLVAPTDSLP
jgi:hypothetical protein